MSDAREGHHPARRLSVIVVTAPLLSGAIPAPAAWRLIISEAVSSPAIAVPAKWPITRLIELVNELIPQPFTHNGNLLI